MSDQDVAPPQELTEEAFAEMLEEEQGTIHRGLE